MKPSFFNRETLISKEEFYGNFHNIDEHPVYYYIDRDMPINGIPVTIGGDWFYLYSDGAGTIDSPYLLYFNY